MKHFSYRYSCQRHNARRYATLIAEKKRVKDGHCSCIVVEATSLMPAPAGELGRLTNPWTRRVCRSRKRLVGAICLVFDIGGRIRGQSKPKRMEGGQSFTHAIHGAQTSLGGIPRQPMHAASLAGGWPAGVWQPCGPLVYWASLHKEKLQRNGRDNILRRAQSCTLERRRVWRWRQAGKRRASWPEAA